MRIPAYYMIRPTDELRREVLGCGVEAVDLLLEPQLWAGGEGGRTVWRDADYEARVKLLFLAWLRTDYLEQAAARDAFHEFLEKLLGHSTDGLEVFDQWWVLDRYVGHDQEVGEVEGLVSRSSLEAYARTGRPLVDQWVQWLIEKRG